MDSFKNEVNKRWGDTKAFAEFTEKAKDYSEENFVKTTEGLNSIFGEFAECMQAGSKPDSDSTQALVGKLQNYITDNFYTCTNEILSGLGQMYVGDERFKNSIDKNSSGTAEYVFNAISFFCRN